MEETKKEQTKEVISSEPDNNTRVVDVINNGQSAQLDKKTNISQRPAKHGRAPRYKDRRDLPRSRKLAPILRPERINGEEDNKKDFRNRGGKGGRWRDRKRRNN